MRGSRPNGNVDHQTPKSRLNDSWGPFSLHREGVVRGAERQQCCEERNWRCEVYYYGDLAGPRVDFDSLDGLFCKTGRASCRHVEKPPMLWILWWVQEAGGFNKPNKASSSPIPLWKTKLPPQTVRALGRHSIRRTDHPKLSFNFHPLLMVLPHNNKISLHDRGFGSSCHLYLSLEIVWLAFRGRTSDFLADLFS
jgi:hypothetical protein